MDILDRFLREPDAPELPGPPASGPPPDDTPRRRGLRPAPPDHTDRPTVSIDEARAMIRSSIRDYLNEPAPGHMLLIAAPAGIGKTTIGVGVAEQVAASGQRVMYVGPRKEFFQDIIALADHAPWWFPWQSRHSGDEFGLGATCRWAGQVAAWQRRGYPARSFCSNPRVCGWPYIHGSCRYYAQQRQAASIIYAQYEHIALGHMLLPSMSLVIGDELPIRAFLHPWHIPTRDVVPDGVDDPALAALLERLYTLATIRNARWRGAELLDMLGGAAHVAQVCMSAHLDAAAIAYTPELRSVDAVEDVPYFHLPALVGLLGREADRVVAGQEGISRVLIDNSGLTLLLRRTPRQLPPHVIWLDATANRRLYETLFSRPVTVVKPDVALRGHVRQVWAGLNNKMALGTEAKHEHIQAQIARIRAFGYQDVRFVTYKDFVRVLAPDDRDAHAHFGGSRGTNRLAACDCLIVVGAPQPPTQQLLDMAAMLYYERDVPFNAAWTTRDRPYAGQPWAWPIGGFWDDADLQTLLEQSRESELIQAIHRARPLIRSVDVWLLTNVPLDALPVELVSLHALFDAPHGVDPYRWPDVLALAEERISQVGIVTTADLITSGLCQKSVATKYLDALASRQGWTIRRAPAAGRGQPPLACVKGFQAPNTSERPIR